MNKTYYLFCLFFFFTFYSYGQWKDSSFQLLPGENWWGGPVNAGQLMPYGRNDFSFNLNGDKSNNQSSPLLISNKGRWIWSEEPFQFSFKDHVLTLSLTQAPIHSGVAGNTLKDSYEFVSQTYFPTTQQWPDSLLITAPQYNLWIELTYNPNQKDILDYAQKLLDHHYPPGVLMIDDNWFNYYGDYEFNQVKFPNPKKLTDDLHRLGFKVMLWISPFISPDSEVFRELLAKKLILMDNEGKSELSWDKAKKPFLVEWWNGYSACLDLSNPSAQQWLKKKLDTLQIKYGIDGYKLDAGDAYFYDSPRMLSFKKISSNAHSEEWAKLGLNYPLNEYRAMWKMAGQPLVQRLADKAHSWEDLQMLIPQTIAQQLQGYTFTCPDMIGGGNFISFLPGNRINQKLVVRSAQCHALMPMMQFSVAPWRILDQKHHEAIKASVKLRSLYLEDILQAISEGSEKGKPVLKPLEYDFPNQGFENIKDQFLVGDQLMVAPIVTENDEREVVFPKGKWKYKNKVYKGPTIKKFTVALDELLVFEKVD